MREKLNYDYIKHYFNMYNYELLSDTYVNSYSKLRYKCQNNHIGYMNWNNFRSGRRCPICINSNIKLDLSFIKSEFEKDGYKLLTTDYKNNKQKLKFLCNNNHISEISWTHYQSGQKCNYCYGNNHIDINTIIEDFNKQGYRLLSKSFISSQHKLDYICSYGHAHNITWNNWQQGQRCPTCSIINRSGEKHWNWAGGISYEPYCDIWKDKEYKESIKERDNYECQNPNCWKSNTNLIVHHVDYDKKNCAPWNLITLCGSCNSRANFNRDYWNILYDNLIKSQYNYGVANEARSKGRY